MLKIAVLIAGMLLAATSLTGCTAESTSKAVTTGPVKVVEGTTATASPQPSLSGERCGDGEGTLAGDSIINGKLIVANLAPMTDTGPRPDAMGKVTLNADGRPASYTVAAGDAVFRIADRLCITPAWLDALNSVRRSSPLSGDGQRQFAIYIGDVLNLDPATITTVGTENGRVQHNTPTYVLPPQR